MSISFLFIKELQNLGREPIAIWPNSNRLGLVRGFEQMEASALIADPKWAKAYVRVVLEADGTGNIHVSDTCFECQDTDDDIMEFPPGNWKGSIITILGKQQRFIQNCHC